ncbi:hypothetical protein B0H19DRAFT_974800 [Mycena capillaripes]|nr:hypothetical protein B0H19DRAFT_974800 [Mycena capillaripes]
MFRGGDPWNPYDPEIAASLDIPPTQAEFMARLQADAPKALAVLNDPEQRAAFEQYQRDSAAERAITGETEYEQMLREKREWAEADAKSAKLKVDGNEAFRTGDYKTAYVIYTACMQLSGHEPLYPLNRAAVALKLKLYEKAVADASTAIENGDFNQAKALFRRAQGRCFLGEFVGADEDYTTAMALQPGDRNIADGFDELKRLRSLPAEDQAVWISEQVKATLSDIFEVGELKRRVEEVLGYRLLD